MGNDFDFEKEVDNFSEEELIHIQEIITNNLIKRKEEQLKKLTNNVLDALEKILNTDFSYDTVIENYAYSLDWEDIYNYIKEYSENNLNER